MKSLNVVLGAVLMYVIAWFVPVHVALGHLPDAIPGLEAVRAALIPIWPDEGVDFEGGGLVGALFVASVITNVFVLILPLVLTTRSRVEIAQAGQACMLAGVLNAHWVLGLEGSVDVENLQPGYFLWWLSFFVAGFGVHQYAKQLPDPAEEVTATK